MLRRIVIGALAGLALVSLVGFGRAEATVSFGVDLIAPPQLVVVPGTPVAYAPAVPANYFFYGGQYYVFSNGAWFASHGYRGPWVAVAPAYVPRPLLAVPVGYYRAAPWQWHRWHHGAPPHWTPVWGTHWHLRHVSHHRQHSHHQPRHWHHQPHRGHHPQGGWNHGGHGHRKHGDHGHH